MYSENIKHANTCWVNDEKQNHLKFSQSPEDRLTPVQYAHSESSFSDDEKCALHSEPKILVSIFLIYMPKFAEFKKKIKLKVYGMFCLSMTL